MGTILEKDLAKYQKQCPKVKARVVPQQNQFLDRLICADIG